MSEQITFTPTRPYLARAIYEWICDNQLTPYLLVDATQPHTDVPLQFVKDGQIVLNLAPHAVHQLHISNEAITFSARFAVLPKKFTCLSELYSVFMQKKTAKVYFSILLSMLILKTQSALQTKNHNKKLKQLRKNLRLEF